MIAIEMARYIEDTENITMMIEIIAYFRAIDSWSFELTERCVPDAIVVDVRSNVFPPVLRHVPKDINTYCGQCEKNT